MTPEEKEAAKKRIYPLMQMLLATKEFECDLMKLLLEAGQSQPNAEVMFNKLQDMLDKLNSGLLNSRRRTLDMLYAQPFTEYDRERWETKLHHHRFLARKHPRK